MHNSVTVLHDPGLVHDPNVLLWTWVIQLVVVLLGVLMFLIEHKSLMHVSVAFLKTWWVVIACSGLILAVALRDLNYNLAFSYCCYIGAAALGRWVFLSLLSPMFYAWLARKRAELAKKEQAN